ncbi:MAG: DUF4893 domain-containing protein [Rhizobiales bacterium]|nr:DUF4893 domain-containing protein [Hyphomicrobiales bacterium]
MKTLIAAVVALLLTALPAWADGELDKLLSAFDKDRLARFETIRKEALKEARAGGNATDLKTLDSALAGTPLPMSGSFDASGNWRCRTVKVGGLLPLVVYPWFKCSIADDGSGWFLKKTTGSQMTQGRFYTESDTRLVYLGAGHVRGDNPRKYGEAPKEDQVAIAERLAENRLVLQFPAPQYESKFDLLVMERVTR